MEPSTDYVSRGMKRFLAARAAMKKIDYRLLYCYANLKSDEFGYDSTTGELEATEISLFTTAIGERGLGFAKVTRAETSLDSKKGGMSTTQAFIGLEMGVDVHESNPLAVHSQLRRRATLRRDIGSSNKTEFGLEALWPCADIGVQSLSVADGIPGNTVVFPRNGSPTMGMRKLPPEAEIFLAPGDDFKMVIQTQASIYLTSDGLPLADDGHNELSEVLVGVVIGGWFFEDVSN